MSKEYHIVYDYNGYQISAMNGDEWIPTKEIAEKLMSRMQEKPYFRGDKLYLIERNNPIQYPEMKMYNGKPVYEYPYLYWDALDIGDLVSADVAHDIENAVPPIMYGGEIIQCGEPHSTELDKKVGKYRSTYLTLRRVNEDVYQFMGFCFGGETRTA